MYLWSFARMVWTRRETKSIQPCLQPLHHYLSFSHIICEITYNVLGKSHSIKLTEISKGATELTTDRISEKDMGFPAKVWRVKQPQRPEQCVVETDWVSRKHREIVTFRLLPGIYSQRKDRFVVGRITHFPYQTISVPKV